MVHLLSVTIPSRTLLISLAKRILDNSSAANLVKPTALGASPRIICPAIPGSDKDRVIVNNALSFHRASVRVAQAQTYRGMDFPPFKAIFKSEQYSSTIRTILDRSLEMPNKPVFICIRSEAEAQDYEAEAPSLWQECNSGRRSWGTATALFLCPEFLKRGQNPGSPQFKACPGVAANRFHTFPNKPILFGDRSSELTDYLLVLENTFVPYAVSEDPNVYMNLPLGWNAEQASQRMLSYLMFIQRELKTCAHWS